MFLTHNRCPAKIRELPRNIEVNTDMGTEQQLKSKSMPRVLERQRSSPVSPRLRARKVVTWALDKDTQPAGEGGGSDKDEASDKENAKNPQRPRALAMASGRKGPQIDEAEVQNNAFEDEVEGAFLEESDSVKGKLEVLQRAHVDALRNRLGVGVEVEALRLEIKDLREENRTLREARIALEKENANLKKEFHAALRDNQAWCRESEVLQEEFTQAFLEKTTEVFEKTLGLERENETLRHESEALKVSLAEAESSRNAAVRQNKAWQHENHILHEEYKEHLSQSVEILRENTALKEQIAVSNDEYSRITASTKAYVHKLLETKAADEKVDPEFAGDGDDTHVDVPRVAFGSNRNIEIIAGAGCGGRIDPASRQQQEQMRYQRHQRHQARPSRQANGLSSRGRSKAVASPSMKPPEQEGERALVGPGRASDSDYVHEGGEGEGGGGDDEGERDRDRRQRQRKGLSLPTDVSGELAKRGGLEVWVQGWKWLWSDENEQDTKQEGSKKQEESKEQVGKIGKNLEGQVEGLEEVAEDGAIDGIVRMEEGARPSQTRSAAASASRGGKNNIAAARAAMRGQKVPKQQQAESDADVDVGDGDKDCKDCSETQEAKVWKSDNEKWLEGTKTWKRADKVLKRAESMPRDFWGAEPKEEDSAFPVTLSMKLENRAFRADYIETLRASQLSPCPAVDYDDFSEGSTDTDEGF